MNTFRAKPPDIVVFTGGALAREAGFAPFDPVTMPAGLRLEDVVTGDGFARDPERVNGFYNRRRRELMHARPNAAHEGLAVLETMRPQQVLIATRNIDDLHERAGSKAVIHTHGELLKARCTICTNVSERLDDIAADTSCPVCGNRGHLRPHIVWVGEEPLRHRERLRGAGAVQPVPGDRRAYRRRTGKRLCRGRATGRRPPDRVHSRSIIRPGPFDEQIAGALRETVPAYVRRLIAEA